MVLLTFRESSDNLARLFRHTHTKRGGHHLNETRKKKTEKKNQNSRASKIGNAVHNVFNKSNEKKKFSKKILRGEKKSHVALGSIVLKK
jgi:hypothetical protein